VTGKNSFSRGEQENVWLDIVSGRVFDPNVSQRCALPAHRLEEGTRRRLRKNSPIKDSEAERRLFVGG